MVNIPARVEDFSVSWLNQVLEPHLGEARVIEVNTRLSDIPGQTAEIALLDVNYDQPIELPTQMVAKFTSQDPMILEQIIANYDQYRRETAFYREFPDPGIAVPRCLFEQHDPVKQEFVILMKDLKPALSPSWGVSQEQVAVACDALPPFHARWWNQPSLLEKDWMVQRDNRVFYETAFGAAHQGATIIADLFESTDVTCEILELCSSKLDRVLDFIESRPFTFVHGDYHAKQMFFETMEGGDFAVIDWQFPFVAPGAWDLARLTGMCLATEQRRPVHEQILQHYHAGLVEQGVTNYSPAELETDYQFGLIVSQMIMVIASVSTDYHIFEKECVALGLDWRDVMFDRTHRALEDLQVLELVKAL